jgi:hypothetical protein
MVHAMLATRSHGKSASIRTAAGVCAMSFLGLIFNISSVGAQSGGGSSAPWQNPPNGYRYVPAQEQPRRIADRSIKQTSAVKQSAYAPQSSEEIFTPQPVARGSANYSEVDPQYDAQSEDIRGVRGMIDEGDSCAGPNCACNNECEIVGNCLYGPECNPFCRRLWFSGEYLMWWGKGANMPVLATTGILGAQNTSILFGGGEIDEGMHSGGRFTLGYWLNPCQDFGIEATYLTLANQSLDFDAASQGNTILERPFLNVLTGQQDAGVIASHDAQGNITQSGSINISFSNEFSSAEVLLRRTLIERCDKQMDFLIGYRYGRFAENLSIDGSTTILSEVGAFPINTVIRNADLFAANNEFNGGEFGFSAKTLHCRWTMELLAKLALGSTRSRVTVNGSTVVNVPGELPVTTSGGFLALPTNIGPTGLYEQNNFTVIPELGVTVGYNLTCRLKATVGYSFLYWSKVARPGDQINTNLNPSQFAGQQLEGFGAPQFHFNTNDYWVQGINLGLEYRF